MRKTTKILVSALLTLCMLLPMAMPVFATTASPYDGSEIGLAAITTAKEAFIAGTKTTIDSANDLVAFSQAAAAGTTFSGKTITLTTDVVLNEGNAASWEVIAPAVTWTPIKDFQGTFNGNGKTVSGLYVNTSEAVCVGLFGCLKDGAQVLNLGVVNSYMINTNTSTASDTATPYMGSIAGMISGKNVRIIGCYSDAILSAGYTGGIVGVVEKTVAQTEGDPNTQAVISECVFDGRAHAITGSAAGIVATTDPSKVVDDSDNVKIADCVNFGVISNVHMNSGCTVGGIVGLSEQYAGSVTLERCLNFGSVMPGINDSSNQTNKKLNALFGQVRNNASASCVITDCYIFTTLGQILFANSSVGSCNNCSYTINGNTNSASNTISAVLENEKSNYTIEDIRTIKGEGAKTVLATYDFAGTDPNKADWDTYENGYPMPKVIKNNYSAFIGDTMQKLNDRIEDRVYYQTVFKTEVSAKKTTYTTAFEGGTTTFVIKSESDLVAIAELLNSNSFTKDEYGLNLTFELDRDIIFNAGGNAEDWATEAPAFEWPSIKTFRGTFDGKGHTISGIYINKAGETGDTGNYYSFFGVLNQNATVKNFGIVNSYMRFNHEYAGGVIGRVNKEDVTVSGIYSEAILDSYAANSSGGIIGLLSNTGSSETKYTVVENCVFAGIINATKAIAGGIVGHGAQYQYNHTYVKNCANCGTVKAAEYAGAIVAQGSTVTIENCLNYGTVTSAGKVETHLDGALVGSLASTNAAAIKKLTVTNSYNTTEAVISNKTIETAATTNVLAAAQKSSRIFNDRYDSNGDSVVNENDNYVWTAMTNYAGEDQYPLPTVIYENFFKIKLAYYQTTDLDTNDNTYDLRIIAEIDSLDYAKAGFKVTRNIDSKTLDVDTTEGVKVYKTVTGGGEDVTAIGDKYFVTITIEGISGAQTITVTPYTNGTANGELVEGAAMELSFDANGNLINN
ncbi:MAG: hypothetical protein E7670_06485 [Ruminococcaceae bacterium]|nr:hypothetical protein [Oscillospiraceae bacterium]